jgi:hypothetical protein
LPNVKGLVYRSRRNLDPTDFDIVAFDLRTRERHVLAKGLLARYVHPGSLVFVRADGAVLAAPFDQDRLKLTGAAVPLFEGVMTKPFGSADFAISKGERYPVPGQPHWRGSRSWSPPPGRGAYAARSTGYLQSLGEPRAEPLPRREPFGDRHRRGGLS